jgi:hypothetical protein
MLRRGRSRASPCWSHAAPAPEERSGEGVRVLMGSIIVHQRVPSAIRSDQGFRVGPRSGWGPEIRVGSRSGDQGGVPIR